MDENLDNEKKTLSLELTLGQIIHLLWQKEFGLKD